VVHWWLAPKFAELVKALVRHCGESGNPDLFEIPEFRAALQPEADQPG
jgi:hypothetical protein